jgi:hypothetical protein
MGFRSSVCRRQWNLRHLPSVPLRKRNKFAPPAWIGSTRQNFFGTLPW